MAIQPDTFCGARNYVSCTLRRVRVGRDGADGLSPGFEAGRPVERLRRGIEALFAACVELCPKVADPDLLRLAGKKEMDPPPTLTSASLRLR